MNYRDPRTELLVANRRAAAAAKKTSTLTALEGIIHRGERVSFKAVQRAAGVSTWYVYNNRDVRASIEAAISDQGRQGLPPSMSRLDGRTVPGLQTELANARAEIRDLRDERSRLKQRLQRSLGNQVDSMSRQDMAEELASANKEIAALRSELESATASLAVCNRERDEAIADREGAQLALRQTMRSVAD